MLGQLASARPCLARMAFVPVRLFLGRGLFNPSLQRRFASSCIIDLNTPRATLRARDRRREADQARVAEHHQIKKELDQKRNELISAVVSISPDIRKRCSLTHRMSRVKVFFEPNDLANISNFRNRIRVGLTRLYPELENRGLLRVSDGFDLRVGGSPVINDLEGLQNGVERCERAGSALFVEVIPHNAPPPKPPLSNRVNEVRAKANEVAMNPNHQLHMVSFYKFVDLERPELIAGLLERAWSWMGVKGRIYVASEGVNAQLAVPDETLSDFQDAMKGVWIERGESVIPPEIAGVFLNVDKMVHNVEQPFEKLNVRAREKILADGFDKPLDWNKSGREVSPEEWHQVLTEQSDDVVVLDCRNGYESGVGRFEGAEPLNTSTFRDSWDELEKRLQGEDRSKKLLTYCTGGIRCVKVNAFLEQKLGFTNTGRLQGGIVSYAKKLRETGRLSESKFKGVNHVFDGRMGEVITNDLLDRCINCGQLSNIQTDCANVSCPRPFDSRMFVQCTECASDLKGACSDECQDVIKSRGVLSESGVSKSKGVRTASKSETYADLFSISESALLKHVRQTTENMFANRAHMLSSHAQASLVGMLLQISRGSRVLEIGTFTGYATLAIASILPEDGQIYTVEVDPEMGSVAQRFFDMDDENGGKISLIRAAGQDALRSLIENGTKPFDLVFIDADKGGYQRYTEIILDNGLVESGGLILFDNVLFRGEVADIWEAEENGEDDVEKESELVRQRLRNVGNVRKTAKKIHEFNKYLKDEDRLEQVMLPFRDGLTVGRRK